MNDVCVNEIFGVNTLTNGAEWCFMKILIISDGRPGHYNQSLGIVSHIREAEFNLVEVAFRSKLRDNFLRLLMRLLGWMPMPNRLILSFLNMALSPELVGEILTCDDYDIILSTGSSVAAVNLLMGKLINAYTVVCTRPSPLGIAYFDLAILPQHHWPRVMCKKVCQTLGVPNLISPENIEKRRNQLHNTLNLSDQPCIGILLGGEDRYFTITPATATQILDTILNICETLNGQLALTTSRRTPEMVEELMCSRLSSHSRCVLLALASKNTNISQQRSEAELRGVALFSDPVSAIFAISDVIVVTEDSFSMVCEAASSGQKVVILSVDKKSHRTPKRHRTYTSIMQVAPVSQCGVEELADTLLQLLRNDIQREALRDAETAAHAIIQVSVCQKKTIAQ